MPKRDDDGDDQFEDEAEDDENEDEAEDDESEDEAEDDEDEPAAEPPVKSSKSKNAGSRSARPAAAQSRTRPDEARSAAGGPPTRAIAFALVALVAGGAGGWFGHDAQTKAKLRAESAPAAAGSSGPCNAWQQKLCVSSGEQSATCQQAKGASELLTPSACEAALSSVPATLAKIKAARASCDNLVSKLCNDLPKGSQACALVKDRTPSFPADRCNEMLKHYDDVLGQLRMIDQQGAPGMGGPGMGGPGMGSPHGAMPHGTMPHGAMPQGSPAP